MAAPVLLQILATKWRLEIIYQQSILADNPVHYGVVPDDHTCIGVNFNVSPCQINNVVSPSNPPSCGHLQSSDLQSRSQFPYIPESRTKNLGAPTTTAGLDEIATPMASNTVTRRIQQPAR